MPLHERVDRVAFVFTVRYPAGMMTGKLDWSKFEDALFEEFRRALEKLGKHHRGEVFYAVALYHVYRELDGPLSLPLIGANTEGAAVADASGDFWAERWNPHSWEHCELALRIKPALRLEKALTSEACAGTRRHWSKAEERYFKVLVRLARRLRDVAPDLLTVTEDFITFMHDDEGGPALARRTIPKRRFEALFAATVKSDRERRAVTGHAPADQAAFLVTRFDCHGDGVTSEDAQRQLLVLGEEAVPALLSVVDNERTGWLAAKLLGTIGCATTKVIAALREQATCGSWHARALGMLGDDEWLANAEDPAVAVAGLTAPLKATTTAERTPPLSYRALEAYLDDADIKARTRAEQELQPGRSFAKLGPDGVDEALRALSSKHAVIRWHAASLLGNRGLGKAAGKLILPALAEVLLDDHALVRRLAVLAISRWKGASKPYRAAIAALENDPDGTVRKIVSYALGKV